MKLLTTALLVAIVAPAEAAMITDVVENVRPTWQITGDAEVSFPYNSEYVQHEFIRADVDAGEVGVLWTFTVAEDEWVNMHWYAKGGHTELSGYEWPREDNEWDLTYPSAIVGWRLWKPPAGNYSVRALFRSVGDDMWGQAQLQVVHAVPEPATNQMLLGGAIGILCYLLIRFAFPPEGGYPTWKQWRNDRRKTKHELKVDYEDTSMVDQCVDLECFGEGWCPMCRDEQMLVTDVLTPAKTRINKIYECQNCKQRYSVYYTLSSLARIATMDVSTED